jgi:phosphoribosylformylglycinamidine synthase
MKLTTQDLKDIHEIINREPSLVETYIFDTMWSEHCSYKSSKPVLKTLPTNGRDVMLGIGEDSGIVYFTTHNGKRYGIAISHESHNHPSQILPIEGAATGVGGVVRDVYCMGADVIGVLNSLHFGIPKNGKGNPIAEEIAEEVVVGVSDYANPLGVPVLGGETVYHHTYNDNCLVNVAAVGLVEESRIIHSYVPDDAKKEKYVVILFGKSTDSTGFGGASFSSATLDEDDEKSNIGAVQVHDPFLKRVIVEALKYFFDDVAKNNIPIGCKDLGAGGIACGASEIAAASGFGVNVNLDNVNVAVDDLAPEVIACSETQERFVVVVPEHYAARTLEIFNDIYELPKLYKNAGAAIVGEVVNDPVFKLTYQDEIVCELPVQAITTEVRAERHAEPKVINRTSQPAPTVAIEKIKELSLDLLSHPNNCSKRFVYRFFDNAVRGNTVTYPGETNGVMITPIENCNAGLTASMDSNLYGNVDPYLSGAYAVAEGVRNVVSVGATPIAITDCLNYGNPEKPPVFFDFQEGVRGIKEAAESLSVIEGEAIPVISGNVSLYNESSQGSAVIPSPVIVVLGKTDDYKRGVTFQINTPGMSLYYVGERMAEFTGTQIAEHLDISSSAPVVRFDDEATQNTFILSAIKSKKLAACHDISMGGLWISLVEMVCGERGLARCGLDLQFSSPLFTTLFSENGGYVIAVDPSHIADIEALATEKGVKLHHIGNSSSEAGLRISHETGTISYTQEELNSAREIRNPN